MNNIMKGIGACLLILLLFSCVASVSAGDVEVKQLVPMFLSGTLYVDSDPAETGLTITAIINNTTAGTATTTAKGVYGTESAPMMVQAGADETLNGSPVSFYVNGVEVEEIIPYAKGVNLYLDLHVSGAALNKLTVVPKGGTVFLGEENLDVSRTLGSGNMVAWRASSSGSYYVETINNPHSYYIDPAKFGDRQGNWYQWNGNTAGDIAFVVKDPTIDFRVWNQADNQYVTANGKVAAGDYVNFRIDTNLNIVISQRGAGLTEKQTGIIDIVGYSNTSGEEYSNLKGSLRGIQNVDISLKKLSVTTDSWYWPYNDKTSSGWNTGAVDPDDNRLYVNGAYGFYSQVNLNNLKENYENYYGVLNSIGHTGTSAIPFSIVDKSVTVSINPSTLTRSNSFYVTIGGKADREYIIVITQCDPGETDPTNCCASKMSGAPCDRPPAIRANQSGVTDGTIVFDSPDGPFNIGNTSLSPNCCEMNGTIRMVVPTDDKPNARDVYANGVYYYAQVKTNSTGYKTVEFYAGSDVAAGRPYRIHVQSVESVRANVIDGDGLVTVNKGQVTLNIKENAPYYLGNDITLTGINTDSKKVYLFMTGAQCQNKCGNDLLGWKVADKSENIIKPGLDMIALGCKEESDQFTAIEVPVKSNGSWSYTWQTGKAHINPGTYTVYASSQPIDGCCLDCACAVTASRTINLEEPCLDAVLEPAIVTKPIECCPNGCSWTSLDTINLTGTACGFPHTINGTNVTKEINMWIFGEDKVGNAKYINAKIPVFCDDTFQVNLLNYIELCNMGPGEYKIILQHPMYNHQFDMVKETDVRTPIEDNRIWMVTSYPVEWSKLFPLEGQGYYQGSKAVTAITDFLDQGLVDDKYIILTLKVVDDRVPDAEFSGSPTEGSSPLEVQFKDASVGKNLTQWKWSFGDGTTSTDRNPKHSYSENGKYTVSLTVMNREGKEDTATKIGYIKVKSSRIIADFTASPTSGPGPLKVMFYDKSGGSPTNWFWDFGDGYTSTGVKDPSHIYQYSGEYTVTLTTTLGEDVSRKVKERYIKVIGGPQPPIPPTTSPYDPTKIYLVNGWNFVSVARTLSDSANNASAVFGSVPTGGHAIWTFDPYKQYWDQILTGSAIQPLYGYWIYSTSPYTINLIFKNDVVTAPPTRGLPVGWAAIGFTGSTPATAKDTLKSVQSAWVYVRGFNAQTQQWEATIVNGGQGENTYLVPSKGYWLYMQKPGTLAAIGV